MNLSLKQRIAASFVTAIFIILIMGFTMFYYLDSLNRRIEVITYNTNQVSLLTDEIRISAVSIFKMQRKILTDGATSEHLSNLKSIANGFQSQLESLAAFYADKEVQQILNKMQNYVHTLKTITGKPSLFLRGGDGITLIGEQADRILEAFTQFQDVQYLKNEKRDIQISSILSETKKYMLIILIITFLGTILLGLVIPGKISLPFKKISDAVRELQDCNFDVSIYYNQEDEIGELAQEINKMIFSIKRFEELRIDRINVEQRKFDALANMVKKHILVASAEGKLIYMNNALFSLLETQSDEVLNKQLADTQIPHTIRETYELAIKRRSKIENAEIVISKKAIDPSHSAEQTPPIFTGYANVIPIRGKTSSLDYYLMVLSREVFV